MTSQQDLFHMPQKASSVTITENMESFNRGHHFSFNVEEMNMWIFKPDELYQKYSWTFAYWSSPLGYLSPEWEYGKRRSHFNYPSSVQSENC